MLVTVSTELVNRRLKRHTSGEDVVPDLVDLGPASPRHKGFVDLLERHALAPGEGDGEAESDIYRDDDEPDEFLGPPVGDAQHRDGEGSLAPGRRQDGESAGHIAVEQIGHQVGTIELAQWPAKADCDGVG